ncbi:general glycosylation pathway protein [Helicobacter sp. MIT 05-5294]|nr:general glycosylation pathway protein [Helicobacter sp. MIT 05-5294]
MGFLVVLWKQWLPSQWTNLRFLSLAFIVFAFSVIVRFYYPWILSSYPQYFYQNTPLLNTHDSYFYAQGAKYLLAMLQESWQSSKTATIAENLALMNPPKSADEILSLLSAFLAFCLPLSLEQIFFYLPGFFGSLIVFPIMAITRNFGAIPCAFSGILSAISVSYYNRTLFGYYDTDMLVLVLGIGIGAMILRIWDFLCRPILDSKYARNYAILFALCAFSLGFYANLRYILFGYILILSLFFFNALRFFNKESQTILFLSQILLGLNLILILGILYPKLHWIWAIFGFFLGFVVRYLPKFFYSKPLFCFYYVANFGGLLWLLLPLLLKNNYLNPFFLKFFQDSLESSEDTQSFHYLSVLDSIAEVSKLGFMEFAYRVSGGIEWFALVVLGFIWLVFKDKRFLIFLPFGILGGFSLVLGLRFSFYAVPISAISLGFLLFKAFGILESLHHRILKFALIVGFVCLSVLPHLQHIKSYVVAPILEKSEAEILESLPKHFSTPNDFALAWWDYGYMIGYFSNLKTFIDGGKHSGRQNYPISLALSSTDEILSYNIAKTLSNGESLESLFATQGIRPTLEILQSKPKHTPTQNALFIILPLKMLEIFPNIMRFSSINLDNGEIPKNGFFALSIQSVGEKIRFHNGISLDLTSGEVVAQDFHTQIQKSIDLKNKTTRIFYEKSGLVAVLLPNGKTLLCAQSYLESFYFKGLLEQLDSKLFQKVLKNDKIIIYKLL